MLILTTLLDGNFLVHQSSQIQKPFIFVTLNYRLGYLGFLHSRELRAEAERNGEEYCPNKGLYDQRLGLEWVRLPIVQSAYKTTLTVHQHNRYEITSDFLVAMLQTLPWPDNLLAVGLH